MQGKTHVTTTDTLTHTRIQTNGVSLHVVQAGPEDGPLVVLVHGFPDFWYGWRRQIEFLAAAGYRVYAPDQRGYNLSEKPKDLRAYSMSTLSDDIVGLINHAGREKAFVVAHDWGGGVAWWTATHHAERVEKLVIINSPHPAAMSKMLPGNLEQLRKSWYIIAFQIPKLPEWIFLRRDARVGKWALRASSQPGAFSESTLEKYAEAWNQPGTMTAMMNWYREGFRHLQKMTDDDRVHMPTRILWGARDNFLSQKLAGLSAEYCDDVEVIGYEHGSHWLQHEEVDSVNQQLVEFFGNHPKE